MRRHFICHLQNICCRRVSLTLGANNQSAHPLLAYIYPAMLGANAKAVMICNIVLSCILQLLLFRCVQLLHSSLAGIIAAFLLALHPGISELMPTVLTEPPYLFLCGVWIWGITEAMVNYRAIPALVGGLAFGLAILTRATFLYFAFVLVAMAFFVWRRSSPPLLTIHLHFGGPA